MKKLLATILLIAVFFSCKKELKESEQLFGKTKQSETTLALISEPAAGYNLYIPEDEGGWDEGRVGLYNSAKQIYYSTVSSYLYETYGGKLALNSRVKIFDYGCLIANGTPGDQWDTTLNNDITLSEARSFITKGGIQPTPLGVTVYKDGGVYIGRKKEEFYYTPTNRRLGAPASRIYHGDTSFLWWGWGDMYYNSVVIPEEDGLYVVAVTLDYGAVNPKTSLLPIRVRGGEVVTDTTAIAANAAKPATNYKAVIQRGRVKGVLLTWEGNSYAYCIERWNPVTKQWEMILRWFDGRSFFDVNGSQKDKYRMVSRGQGRIPDARTPEFGVSKK